MEFVERYLSQVAAIAAAVDRGAVARMVDLLAATRDAEGRLFILGVGGSAANAAHAVNDFRKIAGFESYSPTDNVSELTARINDEGWSDSYAEWLKGSRLRSTDVLLVLSVGGGSSEHNVSVNLVRAIEFGRQVGAKVCGIVGRDGGFTARVADACVIVPTIDPELVTPHAEAFQAVIWHLIVSHPTLRSAPTKWESVAR